MEIDILKVINDELVKITNYEYGEFTGALVYPYAVGEYSEKDYLYEDNSTSGEFILTFFHRGNEVDLINVKEEVKKVFADYRTNTPNGTILINYKNKLFIRSGEAELKKMEIYLDIKCWKGV